MQVSDNHQKRNEKRSFYILEDVSEISDEFLDIILKGNSVM